jgi:hypothetical protein
VALSPCAQRYQDPAQEHFRSVWRLRRGVDEKFLAEIANTGRTVMELSGQG